MKFPDLARKLASLKAIQHMTTRCAGSPTKALDEMVSAAPVVARALGVPVFFVLRYISDQRTNLVVYSDPSCRMLS